MESTKCKKIALSVLVLAGLSSTPSWHRMPSATPKGSATWAHTKSDYIGGKDSDNRDFGGLSLDLSKSFGSNVYGRVGTEYTSRSSGNDSMAISSLGWGLHSPQHRPEPVRRNRSDGLQPGARARLQRE